MPAVHLTIKVAFVLLVIGLIIFMIGFVSPYWTNRKIHIKPDPSQRTVGRNKYVDGHINYGLWTYCWDTEEYIDERTKRGMVKIDECWNLINNPVWLSNETRVSQFFETIGLLLVIASVVLLLIAVFVGACKGKKVLFILSAVFCLSAGGCVLLGAIVFGTAENHKHDLSWAFALTILGGLIFIAAGIFIIVGGVLKK